MKDYKEEGLALAGMLIVLLLAAHRSGLPGRCPGSTNEPPEVGRDRVSLPQ
jgi:hypothetical protein